MKLITCIGCIKEFKFYGKHAQEVDYFICDKCFSENEKNKANYEAEKELTAYNNIT